MAQNVLTDNGYNRPTLSDLIQRVGDNLEAAVGPINRVSDSSTGQFIGAVAEELAIAYETSEAIWLSRFIGSASGFALDAIGEWMGGTQRRARTQTQVSAVLYGDEGIPVPANSIASYQNNSFLLESLVTITRGSLVDGAFKISNATQTRYTVRANAQDFSYTRKANDTVNDIAAGVAAALSASEFVTASANGASVSVRSTNSVQGYAVSLTAGMEWTLIGSPGVFRAVEYGPIAVPIGALNNPVSAVPSWTAVSNLVTGSIGNERESDLAYRTRLRNSIGSNNGTSTVDAIRAALLNDVEGVTLAEVIENDTMSIDADGLEPKSILCIVDGGLAQDVAQKIWDCKGAGISTNGDILITAYDSSNRPKLVKFSRSGAVDVWVRVNVTEQEDEETTPEDIVSRIEAGVANYFATLGLGDDVVIQRLYGYIYENTSGIGKMVITASTNGTAFSDNNIPVPGTGSAKLNSVEVTGV